MSYPLFVPKMTYALLRGPSNTSYVQIKNETNNFQGIEPRYVTILEERIFSRPETLFAVLPAPKHAELCKRIIGQNGYFFKLTTANTGAYFIWHCRARNVFQFWAGSNGPLVKALNAIRWRIFKNIAIMTEQGLLSPEEQAALEEQKVQWQPLDSNSMTATFTNESISAE